MNENFIDKLLIASINHMTTNDWEWPETWDMDRKLRFLDQCLKYAEQNRILRKKVVFVGWAHPAVMGSQKP